MKDEKYACPNCGKTTCNTSCSADSENPTVRERKSFQSFIPSCDLSAKRMLERKAELMDNESIFQQVDHVSELANGYDFVFTQPKDFSYRLLEFINFERSCCSSFTFSLEFEPYEKATHLKIFGSISIKEELRKGFTELNIIK